MLPGTASTAVRPPCPWGAVKSLEADGWRRPLEAFSRACSKISSRSTRRRVSSRWGRREPVARDESSASAGRPGPRAGRCQSFAALTSPIAAAWVFRAVPAPAARTRHRASGTSHVARAAQSSGGCAGSGRVRGRRAWPGTPPAGGCPSTVLAFGDMVAGHLLLRPGALLG